MRDELLDGEILLTLVEAKYIVDRWRMDYTEPFVCVKRKCFSLLCGFVYVVGNLKENSLTDDTNANLHYGVLILTWIK